MIALYSALEFNTCPGAVILAITVAVLAQEAACRRPSLILRVSALRSESGEHSHTSVQAGDSQ